MYAISFMKKFLLGLNFISSIFGGKKNLVYYTPNMKSWKKWRERKKLIGIFRKSTSKYKPHDLIENQDCLSTGDPNHVIAIGHIQWVTANSTKSVIMKWWHVIKGTHFRNT